MTSNTVVNITFMPPKFISRHQNDINTLHLIFTCMCPSFSSQNRYGKSDGYLLYEKRMKYHKT